MVFVAMAPEPRRPDMTKASLNRSTTISTNREEDGARSLFSSIVTRRVTARSSNVPVLKGRGICRGDLCLKNLGFGVINNTKRFHPAPFFCDPASAESLSHPGAQVSAAARCPTPCTGVLTAVGGHEGPGRCPERGTAIIRGTGPRGYGRIGLELIEKSEKITIFHPYSKKQNT